jgi:crotonobetainyl-CoA:carnitine CoA-transferase CaiB-like acyl-CoA transferase
LADLGADVIHIESPWNRGTTTIDPALVAIIHLYPDDDAGDRPWNRSGGFNELARNKRSATLNLKDERGRAVFAELVKHADVVLENYSPRVMPQLGLGFEALRAINPSIVYTSISGYGSTGPGQNRVALGPVIEAAVGLTAMMGYADSGPYRSGVAWADPVAGMAAAAGTVVGLWDRAAAGGLAQRVEVAMAESMATFVGEELLAAQARGTNATRMGNRDLKHAPQGAYRCAGQDRWVAISITNDEEWRSLCGVAGLGPSLASLDPSGRQRRHDEIDRAINAWTAARSPRGATEQLQALGIIAMPVSDARDLCEDPQLEARAFWAEMEHPDVGRRRYPGSAIRLSETPGAYRFSPPGLGEHNSEIYEGILGMSSERFAELLDARVIVDMPPATLE